MWNRTIFGNDMYHVLLWFFTYSILGWAVESFYMSLCNRKLTNRGFARGPFCPIYGVGALTAYFLLAPYSHNKLLLFFMGALLATLIEWCTAIVMIRIFGEVWWDYRDKPFNYRGILCLESTIAWGVYTLVLFAVLQTAVEKFVEKIPLALGKVAAVLIFVTVVLDYFSTLQRMKKKDDEEKIA